MPAVACLAAAVAARSVVTSEAVAQHWDAASALPGFTVGGLAAHLYGAMRRFERALDVPPDPAWRMLRLADFYSANRVDDAAGLDAPFQVAIRDHAHQLATRGPAAVAAKFATLTDRLAVALPTLAPRRPVPVWQVPDGATTVADYLRTRVVELVVHADDLAVSVGTTVDLPDVAVSTAVEVFVELARARAGDVAVVRAFTRAERAGPDVLRVL